MQKKEKFRIRLEIPLKQKSLLHVPNIKASISNVKNWSLCILVPRTLDHPYAELSLLCDEPKLHMVECKTFMALILEGNMQYKWMQNQEKWQMKMDETWFSYHMKPVPLY